jgi:dipeptide/tripeptide permease
MSSMRSVVRSWQVVVGIVLVVIGVALLALPTHWIEGNSGTELGDDGLFELLLGLVPLVLGVGLLVLAAVRRHGQAASRQRVTRKVG